MKVLAVDDSRAMRFALESTLITLGHEVRLCETAEEALDEFANGEYHLAVLDWVLPGMSGLELCREIRKLPGGDACIILMITSRNRPEDLEAVLEAGADDYLAKPVEEKLLMTRLRVAEKMALTLMGRVRMESQLKESLRDKETLIKEVHHRVKNNLQVVSSLLALQGRQVHDPETRDFFNESENRVRTMSMIHEKLYRSADLASIDLSEYINELVEELYMSFDISSSSVKMVIEVQERQMDIDTLIPCGLIINELVSNAFKHAFKSGTKGEFYLGIYFSDDGNTELIVRDNGPGLPMNFDISKTRTLGLRLVNSLVKQINGKLNIYNDGGTEYKIVFKERRPGSAD
jgi:two-component sensor histidine kinase